MTEDVKKTAETAFIRARIHLLKHRPFYAHLVLKLRLEWMEDVQGGLSATDGEALFINPVAFSKLAGPQQVTTLVHEVLHCASGHLWRRGNRDPQRWNMAADVAIDNIIYADRFEPGPWEANRSNWLQQNGLSLQQFEGQFAEAIYELLPSMPPQMQCGCGGAAGRLQGKAPAGTGERRPGAAE